jgi:hypothetical protein
MTVLLEDFLLHTFLKLQKFEQIVPTNQKCLEILKKLGIQKISSLTLAKKSERLCVRLRDKVGPKSWLNQGI